MKKYQKYIIAFAFIIVIAATFFIGSHVGATNASWATKIVSDAQTKISDKSTAKVGELTGDIQTTMATKLQEGFAGTVQQKQDFLDGFIQNYFLGKIDTVKDTPEYQNIQRQIDIITDQELARVKKQIDDAVANALK
jgi:hypothetical protein